MALWVITYYWTRIWDSCQESKTENLCVLLILLEFWKLLFILRSADLAIICEIYICSAVGYRFVSLSCVVTEWTWGEIWSFSLSKKPATHLAKIARSARCNWLPRSASKIQYSWCQVSAIFAGDKIGSPRSANKITKCLTGPKEQRTK